MRRKKGIFMICKKLLVAFIVIGSFGFHETVKAELTDKELIKEQIKKIESGCVKGDNYDNCSSENIEKIINKKSQLEGLREKFKFGIAIGFEHYKSSYISEVEIIGENKIVRVVESQNQKPSVWLETHYLWDGWAKNTLHRTHSAPGFYVGARLLGPNSETFEAFSLGLMWSFKRTAIGNLPPKGQVAESINIGVGPVWHKTKVLASGIAEGCALPENYSDIKLNSRDEVSWMVMISTGF